MIQLERRPDGILIRATGYLDATAALELVELMPELEGAGIVVINVTRLLNDDPTSMGILVNVIHKLRQSGATPRLVMGSSRICRIFEITGLTAILPIFPDLDAAFSAEAQSPH